MPSLACHKWSQGLIPSFPILPCLGLGTLSTPIHTKQGGLEKQTAVQGVVETMPACWAPAKGQRGCAVLGRAALEAVT